MGGQKDSKDLKDCYISNEDYEKICAQGKKEDIDRLLEAKLNEFSNEGKHKGVIRILNEYCTAYNPNIKDNSIDEDNYKPLVELPRDDRLISEFAKDVSKFEDLYQSKEKNFYDGITEYEMLKRGMTEQERIEHGYYVAYQVAEALEKKLK